MTADLFKAFVEIIGGAVVALLLNVVGWGLLVYEVLHPPTHPMHVVLFTSIGMLGALMLAKKQLLGAAKAGLDVAGPYLPFGRRSYDNPPPPPPKP